MKLTETYRAAAIEAATWNSMSRKTRKLDTLFPEDLMPTPEQFQAVYNVTGQTERGRLARIAQGRIASGATESAWCRYHLRRWALKDLVTTDVTE